MDVSKARFDYGREQRKILTSIISKEYMGLNNVDAIMSVLIEERATLVSDEIKMLKCGSLDKILMGFSGIDHESPGWL